MLCKTANFHLPPTIYPGSKKTQTHTWTTQLCFASFPVERKLLVSTLPFSWSTPSFLGTLISSRRSTGVRQIGQRLVWNLNTLAHSLHMHCQHIQNQHSVSRRQLGRTYKFNMKIWQVHPHQLSVTNQYIPTALQKTTKNAYDWLLANSFYQSR